MYNENMYKGFEILFSEYEDKWSCEGYSSISRKKVKEWVDKNLNEGFKKFDAYSKGLSTQHIGIVTVLFKLPGGDSYWIQASKGRKSIELTQNLYTLTEKNRNIFKKMQALRKDRDKITLLISNLDNELEHLKT